MMKIIWTSLEEKAALKQGRNFTCRCTSGKSQYIEFSRLGGNVGQRRSCAAAVRSSCLLQGKQTLPSARVASKL